MYQENDYAYLRDALSLASRSVYRVRIVERIAGLNEVKYEVESVKTGSRFVVAASELSEEPWAYRVTPAQRRRWCNATK